MDTGYWILDAGCWILDAGMEIDNKTAEPQNCRTAELFLTRL
jgi:hypothetical protein